MSNVLLFLHSILRYFILVNAIIVCIVALLGIIKKRPFVKRDKLMVLFLQIFCDIQLLFGLFLYYSKGYIYQIKSGTLMQSHVSRFFGMEHAVAMLIAIILVHIGYRTAKTGINDDKKFRRLFWYIFIALFIFVAQIPWQGKRDIGRPNMPTLNSN